MAISKEEVVWCYRLILGREPESEAVIQKHTRYRDLSSLREAFLRSAEFARDRAASGKSARANILPRDLLKNEIEYEGTAAELAACVANVKAAWSHLGVARPHFSVLTDRRFLPERVAANLGNFWKSGETEAAMIERMLARHGIGTLAAKTCVEYGCGVGRVTLGLARRFARIHAYDISESHLALAAQRLSDVGVANIEFHVCAENVVGELEECDFFYSSIVFQHNPPPVIQQLVRNALRALRPDGVAIFQVPTYRVGYRFVISEWMRAERKLDMEMHCLPQAVVFSIVAEQNCVLLEVREDNCTGQPDVFISNTFVVQKRA